MSWFNQLFLQEAKAALNAAGSGSGSGGSSVADWNTLLNRPFYTEEGGEVDILTEQELAFSSAGNGLYTWSDYVDSSLIVGATYQVVWDDNDAVECVAVEATLGTETGIALGNLSIVGLEGGNDAPFVFGYQPSNNGAVCYTAEEGETHKVRIYQTDKLDILVNKEVTLEYSGSDGQAMWIPSSITERFILESGKTYKVVWDNSEFEYVASGMVINGASAVLMGNLGLVGVGSDTGEPFVFLYSAEEGMTLIATNDTETTTHTVSVHNPTTVVHTLDKKYLPKAAILAMIDEYMDEALGSDY